jgi:hypothetical protein
VFPYSKFKIQIPEKMEEKSNEGKGNKINLDIRSPSNNTT